LEEGVTAKRNSTTGNKMKTSILITMAVLAPLLVKAAVVTNLAPQGDSLSATNEVRTRGRRLDAAAHRLLERQGSDGEFPGWRSFHEKPGTKTGDVWRLEPGGVLVCKGTPRGYIYTEQNYSNFVLQFEWRYPAGATNSNGGALVRLTGEHAIWPKSLEFQLNMGQAGDFWAIRGFDVTGPASRVGTITNDSLGILRHLPRLAALERPVGEWNRFEGVVQDGTVIQKVNGTKANEAIGCELTPGMIAFTAEGQEIHFRNLKLIVLPQ
jgi:hypothetical protein